MTPTPLHYLRRPLSRQMLALLATVALLLAGFAQATHYHKNDNAHSTDTHLQCLLCLHADRWAGAPDLPEAAAQVAMSFERVSIFAAEIPGRRLVRHYEARGPPAG